MTSQSSLFPLIAPGLDINQNFKALKLLTVGDLQDLLNNVNFYRILLINSVTNKVYKLPKTIITNALRLFQALSIFIKSHKLIILKSF